LCRPALDPEAAYHEAVREMARRDEGADQWSHAAIFWAAVEVGGHDLMASTWQTMRSRWRRALEAQLARRDLPPVPPRAPALPAPPRAAASPEVLRLLGELRKKYQDREDREKRPTRRFEPPDGVNPLPRSSDAPR